MTLNQAYNAARPEMRSDRLAQDLDNARTALHLLQAENEKLRELLRRSFADLNCWSQWTANSSLGQQISAALKVTP